MHLTQAAILVALAVLAAGTPAPAQAHEDWLLSASAFPARVAQTPRELTLDNGILRATFRLEPEAALVSLELGPDRRQLLRSCRPVLSLRLDGVDVDVGGLSGQKNHAFLLPEELDAMTRDERAFHCTSAEVLPMTERFAWPSEARRPTTDVDVHWPPNGVHAVLHFAPPEHLPSKLAVDVHIELYDGLPLYAQWFTVHNGGEVAHELDRFTALQWAMVEAESRVEPERAGVLLPNVHVETDFAFHAMTGADGSAHCVRWLPDPLYETQVNYEKKTRCLLEVAPDLGPCQTIGGGATFSSFRTFVLCPGDDADRDRSSQALCRMYRTLAPWTQENPLMLHLRTAEPDAVRTAILQCEAVGFEMVILSFGSGFDIEDDSDQNLARWKDLADFAHAHGVRIGGYSLLSSRKIEPLADNCLNVATGEPGGQVFGFAPALASAWGQRYFAKLRRFFEHTGFDCL
ncbi:MAG: alpha-galactosidase, partial [Planctomycetota bacterium]